MCKNIYVQISLKISEAQLLILCVCVCTRVLVLEILDYDSIVGYALITDKAQS